MDRHRIVVSIYSISILQFKKSKHSSLFVTVGEMVVANDEKIYRLTRNNCGRGCHAAKVALHNSLQRSTKDPPVSFGGVRGIV